jgi:hypothetical protein
MRPDLWASVSQAQKPYTDKTGSGEAMPQLRDNPYFPKRGGFLGERMHVKDNANTD